MRQHYPDIERVVAWAMLTGLTLVVAWHTARFFRWVLTGRAF